MVQIIRKIEMEAVKREVKKRHTQQDFLLAVFEV